jgi:hypothetical protein
MWFEWFVSSKWIQQHIQFNHLYAEMNGYSFILIVREWQTKSLLKADKKYYFSLSLTTSLFILEGFIYFLSLITEKLSCVHQRQCCTTQRNLEGEFENVVDRERKGVHKELSIIILPVHRITSVWSRWIYPLDMLLLVRKTKLKESQE